LTDSALPVQILLINAVNTGKQCWDGALQTNRMQECVSHDSVDSAAARYRTRPPTLL